MNSDGYISVKMFPKVRIIVAVGKHNIIGRKGKLPWKIDSEIKHFRETTKGDHTAVIMGKTTHREIYERLSGFMRRKGREGLPGRFNVIVGRPFALSDFKCLNVPTYIDALRACQGHSDVWICGGRSIYQAAIDHPLTTEMIISRIHDYEFDPTDEELAAGEWVKFPEFDPAEWQKIYEDPRDGFTVEKYARVNQHDEKYLEGLRYAMGGTLTPNRTGTPATKQFSWQQRFDVSRTVPLLTSKFVDIHNIWVELLWFYSGQGDISFLQRYGVHIWDDNTSREFLDSRGLQSFKVGQIGKGYPQLLRNYGVDFDPENPHVKGAGIDQLQSLIDGIRADPFGRRHIINYWDPVRVGQAALPPCHPFIVFSVYPGADGTPECLDAHLTMRSGDAFLGVPYNIMSYTLMLYTIALVTGLKPRTFGITVVDFHCYQNHFEQAAKQLSAQTYGAPTIGFSNRIMELAAAGTLTIDDFTPHDLQLYDYFYSPALKAKMAV